MPSLTDVTGLRVGHATDTDARTGCTVVLGPFRGAYDARGTATGTRELDALSPLHLVPRVDALLLTGGSAYGLAAADGVMAWLEAHGAGFDTGVARVPIVPTAVIFDLAVGRADVRPGAPMGRAACEAAGRGPVAEGAVGAGTGATVGKLAGPAGARPGGVGSWAERAEPWTVGALAVVNALGDVRDGSGAILAGARGPDGGWLDGAAAVRGGDPGGGFPVPPVAGTNTTLAVVATDAPLTRTALLHLARAAGVALARRITPVHTPFDGDVVFALSTAERTDEQPPGELLRLGETAAWALEQAIERAVRR